MQTGPNHVIIGRTQIVVYIMRDSQTNKAPNRILIRGARVHNLKNLDLEIPLGKFVGIAGVSGSGKSSLALGILYAEGSRRYLEALSTYTRRRMTQAADAKIDSIENIPAALALHQRPARAAFPNRRTGAGENERPLSAYIRWMSVP